MGILAGELHGRASELEAVTRLFVAPDAGLRMVLLEGEAGIGKSQLLDVIASSADGLGWKVLTGRAHEHERARPFGGIASALMSSDSGAAARMAALVQSADSQAGYLEHRIATEALDAIEEHALRGPTLICIEDLHWADPETLGVLRSVCDRLADLPVVVVSTLRPLPRRPELEGALAAFTRAGASTMPIGPLSADAVNELAAAATGGPPGPQLRHALEGASGNPLYVLEVIRALERHGALHRDERGTESSGVGLPPSLGLTILQSMAYLPDELLDVLRVAAVLGASFDVGDLASVTARSPVDLEKPLRVALKAGVLRSVGDQLAFRHELVKDALYDDMAQPVRTALHRHAAASLVHAGADRGRVAYHVVRGAQPGDSEAAAWLIAAGTESRKVSVAVALELFERAMEIATPNSPESDLAASVLCSLFVFVGRTDEAEALARPLLARASSSEVKARARLGLAHSLTAQDRQDEALALFQQIVDVDELGFEPGRDAGMHACLALVALWAGDIERADEAAASALAGARGESAAFARCQSHAVHAFAAQARGELDAALVKARLADDLVDEAWRRGSAPDSHLSLAWAYIGADEFGECEAVIERARRRCEQWGYFAHYPIVAAVTAVGRFLNGDWDGAVAEAETAFGRAAADVPAMDHLPQLGLLPLSILAQIAVHRGDAATARALMDAADVHLNHAPSAGGQEWLWWTKSVYSSAIGDQDAARAALERAWHDYATLRHLVLDRFVGPDLARLAVAANDHDLAIEIATDLEGIAARIDAPSAQGAALQCRGLVDDDAETLRAAVVAFRASHRPLSLLTACEDAARVLARRGDFGPAGELLQEAQELADAIGAAAIAARVASALVTTGRTTAARRPVRPSHGWDALTDAELNVVGLVAAGLTNPQIGERLYISRRTVQAHLAHVFAKVGLNSRVQLTAEAVRRGIGPTLS